MSSKNRLFLVGDNPFHNISHLSQERARARKENPSNPAYAADLIMTAMANGANGFTFSVGEVTLAILKELRNYSAIDSLGLYPVVPYAYDYVRIANQLGGVPALASKLVKDIVKSGNLKTLGLGFRGTLTSDPKSMLKTYLAYELPRVYAAAGSKKNVSSVVLHQLVTDAALALKMEWLFKVYIDWLLKMGITPGFNTGNFAFLINKFMEWNIDLEKVLIAAPFNKVGFQMFPTIKDCEEALTKIPAPNVIALSILAAGYLTPKEAFDYIAALKNVKGVAVGISRKQQAVETFQLMRECFR